MPAVMIVTCLILNVMQFIPVKQKFGIIVVGDATRGRSYLQPLRINSTRDDIELFMKLVNVNDTNIPYMNLRKYAPGANVIVPYSTPFGDDYGFKIGQEFLSSISGVGLANSIIYRSYDAQIIISALDITQNRIAEGRYWAQPGDHSGGAHGLGWALLVKPGTHPEQIIIIDDEKNMLRLLIDTSLLDQKTKTEAGL